MNANILSVLKQHLANTPKIREKVNQQDIKFSDEQDDQTIRKLVIGDIIYFKYETEFEKKTDDEGQGATKYIGFLGGDGLAVNWLRCYPSEACRFKTLGRFLFEVVPYVNTTRRNEDEFNKNKKNRGPRSGESQSEKITRRKTGQRAALNEVKTTKPKQREKNLLPGDTTMLSSTVEESQNAQNERLIAEQDENQKKRLRKTKYQKKRLKKGDPLLYEEPVCLKHVYSETYIKINQLKLAKEHNCVKVSLISKMTKECKLNFLDPSNTKKKGEAVFSNDTVSLNFVDSDYVVRVEERLIGMNRLVINAGKSLCMFKVYNYNISSFFNESATSTIRNGDIIKFYNKDTDRYLGTNYNPLNYKKEKTNNVRSIFFSGGESDKYFSDNMEFNLNFLSKEKHKSKFKRTVIPHDPNKNIITTLWEVRLLGCMTNKAVKNSNDDEACTMLKNVITGDFLYCENGRLSVRKLEEDSQHIKHFMFYLKMKNSWTTNNSIRYHSLVTLREGINKDLITFYEKDTLKYEIRVSNSQINSYPFFELQNCGHEKRIAFKIKDINRYITTFSQFIQDFGVEKPRNPDYVMINYNLCLQNEDLFEEKIEEIALCVRNLISIFTEDISLKTQETWKEEEYMRKITNSAGRKNLHKNQNFLMNNYILKNIFYLFTYLVEMSIKSMLHYQNAEGNKAISLLKLAFFNAKIEELYQQKIPPNFFRDYFDKVIDSILNLFYLISYNNSETSVFLLRQFEDFYHLIFFFKNRIFNLLKELTSNSIDLDENSKHVINIIFQDFDLPSFKLQYMERNTIKLRFLKSIIKNLKEKKTNENMDVIQYFRRLFSRKMDRLFFIRFERDMSNHNPEIIGHLFLLRDSEERNERIVKKLQDARKNLKKYLVEKNTGAGNFDKYHCFQFNLNSPPSGKHSLDKLYKFVKYYIKIKGYLVRMSNMKKLEEPLVGRSRGEIKPRVIHLKNIELNEAKGTILDITSSKGINHFLQNSLSCFLVEVYLDFDKYNFFIDDHDYTYFCQKIGTFKLESLLNERPLYLMNPSLSDDKSKFYEDEQIEYEMLEDSFEEDMKDRDIEEDYISVQQTKNYYTQLLNNLRSFHESMQRFKVINSRNIYKVIQLMHRITSLMTVLNKFIQVGFPTAAELKDILNALNVFITIFLRSVVNEARNSSHFGKHSNEYSKHFSRFTKFMVQTTQALISINKYRLHLVCMIIMKFFHTLSLRRQFDSEATDAFFESWVRLFSVLNLDEQMDTESKPTIKISSYSKFQMVFNKENQTYGVGGVGPTLKQFMEQLTEYIPSLMLKSNENFPIKICGNLMETLFGFINNEKLSSSQFKQTVKRSLKQFDEQHYIKELRGNIQSVLENYYLRPVKIISKLRNTEIIFDDPKLKGIMDLVEFGPDEAKFHKDQLKKHRNLYGIINSQKKFLHKIEMVNIELTEQYLNKIYFKKMQKMTQISKITEICHLFLKQIFEHLTGSFRESGLSEVAPVAVDAEVKSLFFQIKRIFILQMKRSKVKPLSDEEMYELKDYCMDVFIPKDLECDDLIIELNQYFDEQALEEDIKNIFKWIDETDILDNFDQADIHDTEVLAERSGEIILKCNQIIQYLNIIRHLTLFPNLKMASNFKALIMNHMLQSKIIHKLYEKSFTINFCTQSRANIPQTRNKTFNLVRTQSYWELTQVGNIDKYKNLIRHIGILSKNILELTSHTMSNFPFSKLVFKSQTKYSELEEILLSKKTPLYLRGMYYRLIFESYYTTNNVNFKKVFKLIRRVVNQDLSYILRYCEKANHVSFGMNIHGIYKMAKQRIRKKENEFKEDQFQDSEDEDDKDFQKNDMYDLDDDEEEMVSLDDIDLIDSSDDDPEDEAADDDDMDQERDDSRDHFGRPDSERPSRDVTVFDPNSGQLSTIWFREGELTVFLTEKQKNNKIDGFIPFLADLTTYIISNMKKYQPQAEKVRSVMEAFLANLVALEKAFPKLKSLFGKEIYEHSKLLISMTVSHCQKIIGSSNKERDIQSVPYDYSSMRPRQMDMMEPVNVKVKEKSAELLSFKGYSFIKTVRQTKSHFPKPMEKRNLKPGGLDVIKELLSGVNLQSNVTKREDQASWKEISETSKENSVIRQIDVWEQKTEQVMNILRYSLMTQRISFSDALKDIFDDELVNMEQKLIGSLVRLIENSVNKRYNYLMVFEDDPTIKISFDDIEKAVRFIKINNSDEAEGLVTQNIEEELQIPLDNDETIRTIILLNETLYYRSNTTNNTDTSYTESMVRTVLPDHLTGAQLARVESLTDIEQTNFLNKINHNMINNKKRISRFLSNQSFYGLFLNHAEFNALAIQSWISKRNDYTDVLKERMLCMGSKNHRKFFFKRKIEKILSSHESRFLFLNSTRIMIEETFEAAKKDPNYLESISAIQSNLSNKFLGLFCLRMFVSTKENNLIRSESLEVLYLMMVHGNQEVQVHLYETIIQNYGFVNLIETVESYIKELNRKIQEKLFEIQNNDKNRRETNSEYVVLERILGLDSFKLLTNIFRFLQVLTENCYGKFQDIMREQKFFEHNTNNNLIQKIIDLIIGLGEFISITAPPKETNDPSSGNENESTQTVGESVGGTSVSDIRNRSQTNTHTFFGTVVEDSGRKKKKMIFQSKHCTSELNNKRGEERKYYQGQEGLDSLKSVSQMENLKLKSVIHFGLFFLNDVIMGPNKENQKIVLMNSGLIDFAASIIEKTYLPELKTLSGLENEQFDYYDYLLFSDAVNLFLLTTSGSLNETFYEFVFDDYYLKMMDKKVDSIFKKIITFHKRKLYSGKLAPDMNSMMDSLNKFDVNLNEVSVLAQTELNQFALNTISQGGDTSAQQFGLEIKQFINLVLFKVIQSSHSMFIYLKRAQSRNEKALVLKEKDYYRFYQEFYGYVEIKHQNRIAIAQFTRPYKTHFHYDRESLSSDFDIEPQHEKIVNFIERIDMYEEFLDIRQINYRFSKFTYLSTKHKFIFEVAYYVLLLMINLLFLIVAEREKDGDLNVSDLDLRLGIFSFSDKLKDVPEVALVIVGILNILLALCILVLNFPEDIPGTKYYWRKIRKDYVEQAEGIEKKKEEFRSLYLNIMGWITHTKHTGIGYWMSSQNIYAIFIFGLSILALFIPFIYPFLLLDIVQRSKTLKNIISSVTKNYSSLTQTLILTLIVMFIYATISFTFYPDHYQHGPDSDFQNYCYSLNTCFLTVINNGLRAGGGLGEAIGQPTIDDSRYVLRYIMDLTFMIIILIILLNIVFGIIIDTFGDMRNARDEWLSYLKNTCLLCNLTKSDIDSYGEGYYKHINISHSLDDYVHFIIYIKNKNINNCDGIEQSVKEKYNEGDYSFMPNQESYYFKNTDE